MKSKLEGSRKQKASKRHAGARGKAGLSGELKTGLKLDEIFLPTGSMLRAQVRENGGLFVHYTSAENAAKIIRSKSIWMRNAKCMNDYSEVLFGHQQLLTLFRSDGNYKPAFCRALNAYGDNMGENVLKKFDEWWNNIQHNTYICSISEHDVSENSFGRLSMWRAYGRLSAKAALVFKLPLAPGAATGLGLFVSPVAYSSSEEIEAEFYKVLTNVQENHEFIKSVKPEQLINAVFFMLVMTVVCVKHVGFKEEREWRVIYLPYVRPSEHIEKSVEVIEGVPQPIYKIPLVDKLDKDISGVEVKDLIQRLIIGPSVFPVPMFDAFATLLIEAGMTDASNRIVVSNIPLRT